MQEPDRVHDATTQLDARLVHIVLAEMTEIDSVTVGVVRLAAIARRTISKAIEALPIGV